MLPGFEIPKYTRWERQDQIENVLKREQGRGIPARLIFKWIGLKRTPYSEGLLREMVEAGVVCYEMDNLSNGLPVRLYWWWENHEAFMQSMVEGEDDRPQQEELPF